MIIINQNTELTWVKQGIDTQVVNWFQTHDGTRVADCVTALSAQNITPAQVYWALYKHNLDFVILPESDAEIFVAGIDKQLRGI